MNTIEHPQDISALLSLAKQLGLPVSISINLPLNEVLKATVQAQPSQPARETATIRTTLWALNLLKGAPGQVNRMLVRKFLFQKGWIGPTDEPESWNLEHVPTTKPELAALWGQLMDFSKSEPKCKP